MVIGPGGGDEGEVADRLLDPAELCGEIRSPGLVVHLQPFLQRDDGSDDLGTVELHAAADATMDFETPTSSKATKSCARTASMRSARPQTYPAELGPFMYLEPKQTRSPC